MQITYAMCVFIPNPYWVGELRHLTGRDAPVAEYVFAQPGAAQFVDQYANLLVPVLPHYLDELKPNVTIAMGCTGGKHRSVASAERVAAHLQAAGFCVRTITVTWDGSDECGLK